VSPAPFVVRCESDNPTPMTHEPTIPITVRCHRVLRAKAERNLSRLFGCGMRWPSGFRRMDSPARCITWTPKWAALTRCVHQFYHRLETLFWRDLSRTCAARTHPLLPPIRDPGPARRNANDDRLERGLLRAQSLNITQEGIPRPSPPEMCYMGWQESLTLLAQLTEPEIPDQP